MPSKNTSYGTGLLLQCSRPDCLHTWTYKGQSKFYASCPSCKGCVSLRKKYKDE